MYNRGFYAGKFFPFHKGHQYCIRFAAEQCRELVVILFYHCEEEAELINQVSDQALLHLLSYEERYLEILKYCGGLPNVRFTALDCREMHADAIRNGTDTWDAETEYVIRAVGDFQVVYSSEPGYDAYFRRAYPWADHILIDVPREHVPISGTAIRGMPKKDADRWI